MVSWRPSWIASLSLVPTPSVPGHQHGLAVTVHRQLEERPEPTEPGDHPGAEGGGRQGLDALHQGLARVDVDARVAIAE